MEGSFRKLSFHQIEILIKPALTLHGNPLLLFMNMIKSGAIAALMPHVVLTCHVILHDVSIAIFGIIQ